MGVERAASYGDRHAPVYDRIYGARFAPAAAVAVLAQAAAGGRVLELGVGTGRLAIPLADRGVAVDGIEASTAMIDRLRSRPGGRQVGVFRVDLTDFDLPHRGYAAAVCAVSTLFMLPGPAAQRRCLTAAARHLRPSGRLFVEAFQPDPARFDAAGRRTEQRPTIDGSEHEVRSVHDPDRQCIHITHVIAGVEYEVALHYATTEQLDSMAAAAGLRRTARWHDWTGAPATEVSADPVSVYSR